MKQDAEISQTYQQSQFCFIADAKAAGGEVESYPIGQGHDGTELAVDVSIWARPRNSKVFAIFSGVHGIEGHVGAFCITDFIRSQLQGYLDAQVNVVLVHAVNPWGFHESSRNTIDNIDLNRNFIDFSHPPPANSAYERAHELVCESFRPGFRSLVSGARILGKLISSERKDIQRALTTGQYTHPEGMFFGGAGPTENRLIVEKIVAFHMVGKSCLFLDIHSGLGKGGKAYLVTHLEERNARFRQANEIFAGAVSSLRTGAAVSSELSGMLPEFVEKQCEERAIGITVEFGVRQALTTLRALQMDNWARRNPMELRAHTSAKNLMHGAFYSQDRRWIEHVKRGFRHIAQQGLSAMVTNSFERR